MRTATLSDKEKLMTSKTNGLSVKIPIEFGIMNGLCLAKEEAEEAAKYGLQPGDFKYKDQNEDGIMTNEDRIFQGYTTPRFRWAFRNEFIFHKNISLSCTFYSYWGHYGSFNRAANNSNFPDRCSEYVQPYWTPENRINDYARIGSKI